MWSFSLALCLVSIVTLARAGPQIVKAGSLTLSDGWKNDIGRCSNPWPAIYTYLPGTNAQLTFTGTAVAIYGVYDTLSSEGGISTIVLDGATVAVFNSLPPLQAKCQVQIYAVTGLAAGSHTVGIWLTQYGPDGTHGKLELTHFIYDDPGVPGSFTPNGTSAAVPTSGPAPGPAATGGASPASNGPSTKPGSSVPASSSVVNHPYSIMMAALGTTIGLAVAAFLT
ncbi:hypothetical protein FRB99_008451 [Tulasnella sp. 403]|nr:hypothetical protein FRB99_008451 [Tulasnella sp. 403]